MSRTRKRWFETAAVAVLACAVAPLPAALAAPALPTGGKVVAGQATIGAPSGGTLSITQSTSKAIIDWNGFSIGSGGKVSFANGSGATLNRVTGAQVSSLDGLLSATGSVYLINPNGVIVGRSGVVNVGGTFVASTLDTSNSGFLSGGALSFAGPSTAAVVNYGKVGSLGGDVALIATRVSNAGTITAANGDAGLLAGSRVLLKDASLDEGRFSVLLGGAGTSVTNSGLIAAADAELRAEGGNVYALAGDTAGVIRATGVSSGGGKVWLVAQGGTLDVAGTIAAQGRGGAAGSVETSGLDVKIGATDINAHGGSWTVDPQDLVIDTSAATTIDNALNAGTSVTEQTTATGSSGAGVVDASGSGDIIVAAPLSWNTTAGLTLSAYRNVDVNAAVTLSGGGHLTLYADNAATGLAQASGTVNFGIGGAVTADAASTINVYYNPLGYTDAATNSTLTLRPGFSGPTTYTNPYTAHVTGGTLSAYMLVDTLGQLGGGLTGVGSQLNGLYALNADIDASSTATANPVTSNSGPAFYGFLPIGFTGANSGGSDSGTDYFTGRFDGQGHTISNLYIDHFTVDANNNAQGVNYAGLFGYVNAGPGGAGSGGGIVHDLKLAGAAVLASAGSNGTIIGMLDGGGEAYDLTASGSISGGYFTGGLIGTVYGAGAPYTVYDSSASTTVTGGEYLGGLFGQMYEGATANAVYATGAVGVGQASPAAYVGGLVGSGAGGSLSNSYATGAVVGTSHVGGLAGQLNGTQSNVYATGSVTSTGTGDERVGGLAGDASGTITGAYATGAVNAQGDQVGGLIGDLDSSSTVTNSYATGAVTTQGANVGGLIGYANPAYAVSNSFATGAVTGGASVGGLIGQSFAGSVSTSYASGTVSGAGNIGGLIGNTTDYGNNASGLTISDSYATGSVTGTGAAADAATSYIGGLVGGEQHSEPTPGATTTITRSYATGLVSGQGVQGGLVGGNVGVISNSIWDRTSTGQASGVGATLASSTSNPPTTSVTNLTSVQDTDPTAADYAFSVTPYANAGFGFGTTPGGAAAAPWVQVDTDGTFNGAGGAATATRPFLLMEYSTAISNAHQLQLIDLDPTARYTLTADVEASSTASGIGMWGTSGFIPIGTESVSNQDYQFTGSLDGAGHAISGLYINAMGAPYGVNVGLISNSTGRITDLFLVGGTVRSASPTDVGFLVGNNVDGVISGVVETGAVTGGSDGDTGGLVGFSDGTITGSAAMGAVSGGFEIGGLVGLNGGSIQSSYASGAISATGRAGGLVGANFGLIGASYAAGAVTSTGSSVGGLVGENRGDSAVFANGGTITDSYATGNVSGVGQVGGLVGDSIAYPNGVTPDILPAILGSAPGKTYASGSVTGAGTSTGGLVGENQGSIALASYAPAGAGVTGVNDTGGLVGLMDPGSTLSAGLSSGAVVATQANTGGLVGLSDDALITSSLATGAVTGGDDVGGLVGSAVGGTGSGIEASYATGKVAGSFVSVGGLVGSSTADITGSYATGAVTGAQGVTGGLVGVLGFSDFNDTFADATVLDSYATGAVGGPSYIGGLVGRVGVGSAVTGSTPTATYATGLVVGTGIAAGGLVGQNLGTITQASYRAAGGPTVLGVTGAADVGGLVGLNNAGGAITGGTALTGVSGTSYTGGIVGDNFGPVSTVDYGGAVSGGGGVGGIVGVNEGSGTVDTAFAGYAPTKVTGTGDDVGGIAGASFGKISTLTSTASVSGRDEVGGVVGYNAATVIGTSGNNTVTGHDYVGGLAGLNFAQVQGNASSVVNGVTYVGGDIGWNDAQGLASAISSTSVVTASGDYAGGLIGVNRGMVDLSEVGAANGVVGSVAGAGYVGGLAGLNQGSISRSFSLIPVSGNLYVGGLVGWNDTGATVTTSYAAGAVTGIAGGQEASTGNDYVGGLVGVNFGALTNVYATGSVSGVQVVGGLVGTNMPGGARVAYGYSTGAVSASQGAVGTSFGVQAGEVTDVYGFPALSGQTVASGYYNTPSAAGDGTALTTAQEDGSAAYAGFDFTNIWQSNPDGPPTFMPFDEVK